MADETIAVRMTVEDDRRLDAIAPSYLKGGRRAEQRICWALEELFRLRKAAERTVPPEKPLDVTA